MLLLNQIFLSQLKGLVYNLDMLNRHGYTLKGSQQNEQDIEDFRLASNYIDKIIEQLKTKDQQTNTRKELSSSETNQTTEYISPVTYNTETATHPSGNTIIEYLPKKDTRLSLKQTEQQMNRETISYIEHTIVEPIDVFSNTTVYFEQVNTIQLSVFDDFKQLNKYILESEPGCSFDESKDFKKPNVSTDHANDTAYPVEDMIDDRSDGFNISSINDENLYYHGSSDIEYQLPIIEHRTIKSSDIHENQILCGRIKRTSLKTDKIDEEALPKKAKFNNEARNKSFLKQINTPFASQKQLDVDIPKENNYKTNSIYTATMRQSNTHIHQKPETYSAVESKNNQIRKQIGLKFIQDKDCLTQACTKKKTQMFIQSTQSNTYSDTGNEFIIDPDQKDTNIFKEIQEIETDTEIRACYMKVLKNVAPGDREKTRPTVNIGFVVNVTTFSLENELTTMIFVIKHVPIFLYAVSSDYSIDLNYEMSSLPTRSHPFFLDVVITIIRSEVKKLCVFNILPKFRFIFDRYFFQSDFYVNKIYALTISNAEYDTFLSKKKSYINIPKGNEYLMCKLIKRRTVRHFLSSIEFYKREDQDEIYTDPILNKAIKKLELLQSHIVEIYTNFIASEEGFKILMSQIIKFSEKFCEGSASSESFETGTPKAKNIKRAFLQARAWFIKHMCTFKGFYDNF